MEQQVAIAVLAEAAAEVTRAQALLESSVVAAREAGATWAQVGQATGMTRQAAHERWGHIPRRGCPRRDCICSEHQPPRCGCGHGPGRGRRATTIAS